MNTHHSASIQFQSFINGEREGCKYFYDLHWAYVLSYIESIIKRADIAEDICQECFIRLWQRRERIRDEDHLRYFLFIVARNLSYYHLKRVKISRAVEESFGRLQDPYTGENPEKARIWQIEELMQGIEQLPLQRRMTILYKYFKGWSVKRIAGFLGVAEQTTRNNENQGKQQLKKMVSAPDVVRSKINIPIQYLKR